MSKKCKTCKEEKPIEDFYVRTKQPLAYFPNCKTCFNKKKKSDYKQKKSGKLTSQQKLELKEELEFRLECIKALFKIDDFRF
jgi:hypothetical protein